MPALQSPEFKPQSHHKKGKKKRVEFRGINSANIAECHPYPSPELNPGNTRSVQRIPVIEETDTSKEFVPLWPCQLAESSTGDGLFCCCHYSCWLKDLKKKKGSLFISM
jgi:hypothetical protein